MYSLQIYSLNYSDGTAFALTTIFCQLLVLMSAIPYDDSQYTNVAICMVWMTHRTVEDYCEVFSTLNSLIDTYCPSIPKSLRCIDSAVFISDCEAAIIASLQRTLDFEADCRCIKRCYYHLNAVQ